MAQNFLSGYFIMSIYAIYVMVLLSDVMKRETKRKQRAIKL